jgi:hypothetical protein
VDYFTVHGAFFDPGKFKSIVDTLAARPDIPLVAAVPWVGCETRLYRLRR